MTHQELRKKFQEFFESKGHKFLPSAPLLPENDATTLFTTAGMQPLVPFLLGEKHASGDRLANIQKCVRTGDIDEVGDASHLTFFEMLGNWSLGDYFKKEAIEYSWELLTSDKWLGLDKKRFAVSVFKNPNETFDEESFGAWKEIFDKEKIPTERIAKLNENWWGLATGGPCGPDSEIFYWVGEGDAPDFFDPKNNNWLEIWNNVFMEYSKGKNGELSPLAQKNVDTGMGFERALAVLNNQSDIFQTELFSPIIKKIEELSGKKYKDNKGEFRIIADHLRASVFVLAEKIEPSNTGAGYILRRLIRRAIRYGNSLDIKEKFMVRVAESTLEVHKSIYPELEKNKQFIFSELEKEEEKFSKTLEKGLKEFQNQKEISGKIAFDLYQTYGFPLELTQELAKERNIVVNDQEFNEELKKHQELSRTASAGMFKGGLAGGSEIETKYHTATHLLHAALRKVLGENVEQKGSNINIERMRFDFSHGEKMTDEQKKKVEDMVNEKIKEGLTVKREEMALEEAKASGAIGLFGDKYGEKVSVYTIFNGTTGEIFSKEICGGPHVETIGNLGRFKILKEEAVSAGVRRIKAVLEQ